MSGKGKLCIAALWGCVALLVSCNARYTGSSDDGENSVSDVADVESLDDNDQLKPQFYAKDLVPVSWDTGLPMDVERALLQDASEDYIPEYAIAPVSKRQIRMDNRKRSRLNRLVHQLLSMRGDRYHYDRVAPMRFGGGRR
ncbi:uncharacterized protein [Littorina saxatilis]|uniref:Uncharacterized protein n=1 Tax=Littorina saxatilis TaxID=31220 RepID=A0AAN9GQM8_9CAEN